MPELTIVPIRHHSPAAALQVKRQIATRRPRLVLIEGPADASALIPLLADPETVPPVALYAYRPGAESRTLFYPFCAYSPEYVAIASATEIGAEVRFCDLPASVALDWPDSPRRESADDDQGDNPNEILEETSPTYADFTRALVAATGASSFEEFWEGAFEQAAESPRTFADSLEAFGARARELDDAHAGPLDDRRERFMAATALAARAEGIPLEAQVLVCGAAHAAAVANHLRAEVGFPSLPSARPAELAVIPYSFPRLAESSGYGAGNRAPWFYQEVWERGNDYPTAVRRALIALAARLRAAGQLASLAQCIDAYNLARVLAGIREKVAPGVDELRDAAVACLGQGQPALVERALSEVLVGDAVGRVTQRVGKTPLQSEFYATARRLDLPVLDAPRQVLLHLTSPAEAEPSIFFHRLAVARVPYAREIESGLRARGGSASSGQPSDDPLQQLARVREKWELQWSPATDAALVEQGAWGNTLAEVCERRLKVSLDAAGQIDDATAILLRLVLCDLTDALPAALARCETLSADTTSFPALARAAYHLDSMLTYGVARQLPRDAVADLTQRLLARAILHLPLAVSVDDAAATEVERALILLYELVRRDDVGEASVAFEFWEAVAGTVELPSSHPGLRGLGLTLLELGHRLAPGELSNRLRFWLSRPTEAADNARLVAGLFALHRSTLVRNRPLIAAVTDFLVTLEIDALVPLLPTLRRTLGNLSPAERSYLEETLVAVLGLERRDETRPSLAPEDVERARAVDRAIAATLDRWRARYGLS